MGERTDDPAVKLEDLVETDDGSDVEDVGYFEGFDPEYDDVVLAPARWSSDCDLDPDTGNPGEQNARQRLIRFSFGFSISTRVSVATVVGRSRSSKPSIATQSPPSCGPTTHDDGGSETPSSGPLGYIAP